MNTSQLRACVWAFLLSLWEHVRSRTGGLDCMLLDDPQTYFDPMNRENLAAAVPVMAAHGMRPIITSNDEQFLASLRDKLPSSAADGPSWNAWRLNPISKSRLTVTLSPSVEEIREKRDLWKEDDNDALKAQDFVRLVRVHIENLLWNLLANDPSVMHDPTLGDLLGHLRGARTRGERPFEEAPFERFLTHPGLADGAPFYRAINKAHHRPQEITPVDAGEIDAVFREIDVQLRSCTASYARFMGRLTREDDELYLLDQPPLPPAVPPGRPEIAVLGRLAARSATDILAGAADENPLHIETLGPLAFYAVRSPCLGTLALNGQVVIVSLEREAQDGDPAIVLHREKIFARRIARDRNDPSRVTLIADRSGTERVPPALTLPRAKTRVLPIVGVLYEQMNVSGPNEAVPVANAPIWDRALAGARVIDDSGYPVVRENDLVLLEPIGDLTGEVLTRLEDRIVAAVVSAGGDSFGYLKRMGSEVQPGLRVLEKIGTFGSSVPVFVSETDESGWRDGYVLQRLWRVHGVVRSEILPEP